MATKGEKLTSAIKAHKEGTLKIGQEKVQRRVRSLISALMPGYHSRVEQLSSVVESGVVFRSTGKTVLADADRVEDLREDMAYLMNKMHDASELYLDVVVASAKNGTRVRGNGRKRNRAS